MTAENRHRLQYVLTDYLTTSVAWLLFNVVRYYTLDEVNYDNSLSRYLYFGMVLVGQAVIPLAMMAIYWLSGFYSNVFKSSRVEIVFATAGSVAIGSILIYFVAIIDDPIPDRMSNYVLLILLLGLLATLVFTGRMLLFRRIRRSIARGRLSCPVAVAGDSRSVRKTVGELRANFRDNGLVPVVATLTDENADSVDGLETVPFDRLPEACDRLGVMQVVLALNPGDAVELKRVTDRLYCLDRPLLLPVKNAADMLSRVKVRNVAGDSFTDVASVGITHSYANVKRVIDISLSLLALLSLSPFMAVVALMVKKDSDGPVIYSQERVGMDNRIFRIYKFRTMHVDAEASGPALSSDTDSRITRLGRFLRKYRIDELPQFWNVVKGDMSLVGPRPERPFYEEQILRRVPRYRLVHRMRPGITSWGMVKYGYAGSVDDMVERLGYDMIYLENVSISVDLKIMLFTVKTVFTGKGV